MRVAENLLELTESFIAKGTRRLTDGSFKGINHSEKIHLDLTEAQTVMYIIILHTDASMPSEK